MIGRPLARWIVGAVCAALASACSSSANDSKAPPLSSGSSSGGAVSGSTSGASVSGSASGAGTGTPDGSTSGGALEDASGGRDDAGDDAGDASIAPGNAGDASALAPRCEPTVTWPTRTGIPSVPSTDFGRFGGVSGDELTVAWTSTSGAIWVADRAATGDGFSAAVAFDPGSTLLSNDRVALAPNGVMLVAVVADRTTFAGFDRAPGGTDWTRVSTSQFANLAAMIAESGGAFSEPALGADGLSLFFLVALPGAAPVLAESRWDPANLEWAAGTGFTDPELASADATHRRRPTGISSDGLTLFFYDESAATERAGWRTDIGDSFTHFADLAGLAEAAPSVRCDTLYFVQPASDAGGPGLATAE